MRSEKLEVCEFLAIKSQKELCTNTCSKPSTCSAFIKPKPDSASQLTNLNPLVLSLFFSLKKMMINNGTPPIPLNPPVLTILKCDTKTVTLPQAFTMFPLTVNHSYQSLTINRSFKLKPSETWLRSCTLPFNQINTCKFLMAFCCGN